MLTPDQRRLAVVSALAALAGGSAPTSAGLLPVGEHSFENPVLPEGVQGWPFAVVPIGDPPNLPAIPDYPWIGTVLDAGIFYNPPPQNPQFPGQPTGFLDNMDGNQAAYIGGSFGNEFYQMLSVNYQAERSYSLRMGVAESLFAPLDGLPGSFSTAHLRAELFYLDDTNNRQTVAGINIFDDAATGLRNDHFKYFQVSSAVLASNSPAIGRPVGILFSMGGTLGGYFDVDDVSVNAVPELTTSASWIANADGDWSLGSNWTGGTAPNGIDHVASFGDVVDAPRTVTLDAPKTLSTMNFSSPVSYTIAGDALILDAAAGEVALNVTAGTHTISTPLVLSDNLTITSAASTGLAITGPVAATGQSIFKTGAGSVELENVRAAKLSVTAGLVRVRARNAPNDPAGASVVNALHIAQFIPGAQIDLTNNSAVIDYTGPAGSLLNSLRLHLQSGRLTSTSATLAMGLGYADNAILARTSFAGMPVDSDSLLIKFTYFGDSDLDGDVDVADLGNLASAWQTAAVWTGGDFDYSGFVDVADLGLLASNWQAGVDNPLGPDLTSTIASLGLPTVLVPEPVASGMVFMAAVALKRRRRQVEIGR